MTRALLMVAALVVACGCVSAAPVPKAVKGSDTHVVMETSLGDIEIELFPDKAPKTVANFLGYADDKFYDGLIVHRVIPQFMVQGGGFEPGMKEKKGSDAIACESDNGLSNARGTVAMARAAKPDSATSQFFINLVDNSRLDGEKAWDKVGYCVFGKVVAGMDVADKMTEAKTGRVGQWDSVPTEDIVIKSVRRKK